MKNERMNVDLIATFVRAFYAPEIRNYVPEIRKMPRQTKAEKEAAAAQLDTRRRTAYRARLAGATFAQIAQKLDICIETARTDVEHIRNELEADNKAEIAAALGMENARLDALQLAFWPSAERGDAEAANLVLKISDRRCKIKGLYAPIKMEANLSGALAYGDNESDYDMSQLTYAELELFETLQTKALKPILPQGARVIEALSDGENSL